ncbi:MAG TPA: NYN domain-containing protein [Actinomycetota bacterium]|nr:NYN domain-containing protein [Actinomycetota bacterium]
MEKARIGSKLRLNQVRNKKEHRMRAKPNANEFRHEIARRQGMGVRHPRRASKRSGDQIGRFFGFVKNSAAAHHARASSNRPPIQSTPRKKRMTMATNVYVDGFNLYYGSLRGTPHKWLDLGALSKRLLPSDHIHRIRYFTARVSVRDDPQSPVRQQVYLRALETIPNLTIHYGHFLTHPVYMMRAKPPKLGSPYVEVIKTEEKGSDVNLATLLLLDAFQRDCDTAVVVSNDSDLKLPIEVAQSELGLKVGVVNPHPPNRRSHALQPTFFKQLRKGAIKGSQFPATLTDPNGTFQKPADW